MPNPISVTTFTSTASWRTSALVPAARSPLTVYSEKTRSKSSPRILPATHQRRPRLPYSYHNRAFQGGAGQEETKETSDGSQSKMEEKQYDWAAFLRLRDSGPCERLGCFEIAKWPEHMDGGWHRSAECRSCRSHDRAKRTKT